MFLDSVYKIEEIVPFIGQDKIQLGDKKANCKSLRLKTFKNTYSILGKIQCSHCLLEATEFRLERSSLIDNLHLNLYSNDGILFTKDHIMPKSKGGKDNLLNTQTMCTKCNCSKGNSDEVVNSSKNSNPIRDILNKYKFRLTYKEDIDQECKKTKKNLYSKSSCNTDQEIKYKIDYLSNFYMELISCKSKEGKNIKRKILDRIPKGLIS